ncbi:hypothetical protein UFOVP1287_26 [uncultured Caudovirales phage]|uniref:Uncharacterized protein n=1 Tax=uncultured Caudovirales phage TaxID=2100421 RepID=A0A6J5RUT5_9CAUD|nr:hypothetical protein UFOVP1287_26 [uncultured Caudovirales phage]CAB4205061.1 hypothetical protein UFOVP1408_14 [uncultured Caudovirales phage]
MGVQERPFIEDRSRVMSEKDLIRIFGQLRQLLGEWSPRYVGATEKQHRTVVMEITLTLEEMLTGRKPKAYVHEDDAE